MVSCARATRPVRLSGWLVCLVCPVYLVYSVCLVYLVCPVGLAHTIS